MKAFNKLKSHIMEKQADTAQVPMTQPGMGCHPPTAKDVLRYRYQHACNVGSVFILERWLTPSMFPDSAPGSSELAAVQAWIAQEGMELARQRFEKHWLEYVTDPDLEWMRDVAKCNTIRLPIGYFTLGPQFCEHTAFKKVAPVYENAWHAVQQIVSRCHARGIGVLLDLHGLPGGANTGDHSGTNSGKAELWDSSRNLSLATKAACHLIRQATTMDGVVGVQIINEADYDAKGMYTWYDKVLAEASHIDPTMPIYVSDGWILEKALAWSQGHNNAHTRSACNPVVIDTHLYWAFSDADKAKDPQTIIHEVPSRLAELDGKDGDVQARGAAQVVIGEYSCVLTEDSWANSHGVPKQDLVFQFGNAQSQRYQQRSGGSFFWTYRMDWMPGGEWGFREKSEQGAITPPISLTLHASEIASRTSGAQTQRDFKRGNTWGQHCQYWDTNFPGQYEHHRFPEGWDVGFADATAFFGMRSQAGQGVGGDKIGMLDLWVLKRLRESGQVGSAFAWEWEVGFRQGVRDFCELVGV
ncbi:Glucan 1,3-beta-glucosidase 3 [Saxophila tyrrhenica]|uniref:Glucan 1,3-beta-glucosidase 3 n=1 Tax=Saxophila tyrrhenica TaxID=1690608 RepID=A0AAV9P3C4_9PEZI|nr:Glucan 1,3-beta-glucosidase 3 [Saxophila tyrrhenica]